MSWPCLKKTAEGIVLELLVQPRASRNQIAGLQGDALKIKITSPPVDGAANRCCREFLAKQFGLAKGKVEIIGGETSRHKRVLLRGLELDEVLLQMTEWLE